MRLPKPSSSPAVWSTERILPDGLSPMLATAGPGPLDSADHAYEVKWEGLRVLAGLEGDQLTVRTGAGGDAAPWFPELRRLRAAVEPYWTLLDGELVVMEGERPSPAALQQRLQARERAEINRLARAQPAILVVYDVLRIGDSWLLDVNWEERRGILNRTVTTARPVFLSPTSRDGLKALAQAAYLGLDAVVAKRLRGRYTPGERTREWLTIRGVQTAEARVCGWTERGDGVLHSLILGIEQGGTLAFAGQADPGPETPELAALREELAQCEQPTCPFAEAAPFALSVRWARPEIVCRVRHAGRTDDGQLRSATFGSRVSGVGCRG